MVHGEKVPCHNTIPYQIKHYHTVEWHKMVWYCMNKYFMVWYGTVWHSIAWYGIYIWYFFPGKKYHVEKVPYGTFSTWYLFPGKKYHIYIPKPYKTIQNHNIPYHTIPYNIIPYHLNHSMVLKGILGDGME